MKFRFNRHEMADAMSAVSAVAAARTPKEILRCVRVEARPDVVLLSATDLELSLRCGVTQVEVESPGEALVVAETLGRIVHECTDELLSVEVTDNLLHIHGTGSHFQIVTQSLEDFPPIPLMEGEPDITIEAGALRRLTEWTVFAAARESTRYAINGVFWNVEGDRLTLAATDGRRLSVGSAPVVAGGSTGVPQVIVPGRALTLVGRLPAAPEARVGVKIARSQVLLSVGGATISTSLIEGQFPSYQEVIPSDCDRIARLNTGEFVGALKRASLLSNEESKGVRFSFSDGNVTLSSRAPEQGEAEIAIPAVYTAEPMEIGFNPVFLLEVLRVIHTEEFTFALKEQNRPGVVRPDDDFVHVIMPVNLSSA